MGLTSLRLENFRRIQHAELVFDPRCTLISGANAAGKTSILEAIHVLSVGRSFRTRRLELLLQHAAPEFILVATVGHAEKSHTVGMRWSRTSKDLRIDGEPQRTFVDSARLLPVQVIDPDTHKLVEEGPALRRRFLDWGVFHMEPRFLRHWRDFHRALDQRNAALKGQLAPRLVRVWDQQLVQAGEAVTTMRRAYLQEFESAFRSTAEILLGLDVRIELRPGWDAHTSFGTRLDEVWTQDQRMRSTTIGPHRADLDIRIGSSLAKDVVSRGQQKLLGCTLVLAQVRCLTSRGHGSPVLLLDDPAAELDVHNLGKLLYAVNEARAQLVVTAVDQATIQVIKPAIRFHVEQGRFTRML